MNSFFGRILGFGDRDFVADLHRGMFRCSGCRKSFSLEDFTPLSLQPCPRCKEPCFIPMHLAGYWLYTPLGGGGMGSVYKALHLDAPEDSFAVKILPREQRDQEHLKANLDHEIEVMTAIGEHPCLAHAVSTGHADGEHYLVTRYIEGERLDIRINRLGRLAEREVILHALRLVSGVCHIYNRGYLFRDMKPENVMIAPGGACLFDFGICLPIEKTRNLNPDQVQGSALYYPPERLTDDGEDSYSEIYSLGMVMYHALTGSPYFTARDIETMTTLSVRKTRLIKNNRRDDRIRPDLSRIIERMIKRDPGERYADFIDLEHDLLQALLNRH